MPSISELLKNKIVQGALALVGLILIGSITYYLVETNIPSLSAVAVAKGDVSEDITATGDVEPIQNPDLAFQSAGRVTMVNAAVGQTVSAGTLLASLDTGVLSANLAAAQAKLNELIAGPRAVDLAGQQTAVAQANESLSTSYATFPSTLADAEAKAQSAVALTDPYFNNPNGDASVKSSVATHYDDQQQVNADRHAVNVVLRSWSDIPASVSGESSPEELSAAADTVLADLRTIQTYLTDLANASTQTKTSSDFSSNDLSTANSQINNARSQVNAAILSLTNAKQALQSQALTVQSAQNQLSLTQAGARPEDIEAQRAQVAAIAAQLRQNEIIAPFSGTVASVQVKPGDVVESNTVAVSILPNGAYQVEAYLSEIEMTKLTLGEAADITLDAYGSARVFAGTVAAIDRAPTMRNGVASYKVTVAFSQKDPAITVGMHANITIHAGSKTGVLTIPRTALITENTKTYVLKETPQGQVKTEVTIGLIGEDNAEVLGGLSEGDKVARIGGR